jgi:hypothetical protein
VADSLLTVYTRADGYYLVSSAQTPAGIWQQFGESPTVLESNSPPTDIGRAALACLAQSRPQIAHSTRDEWVDARRRSLDPVLRAAKVRSWRAFITNTRSVDIERTDCAFTVTPTKPLPKPHGALEPVLDQVRELESPTPEDLGRAIIAGLAAATPT